MIQIQTPLGVIVVTSILILFIGAPSYAENVSPAPINFTHFFGCKKAPNHECEILSNDFKSYSFVGNAEKLPVHGIPHYVPGQNGKAVEFQGKNLEAITVGDTPPLNSFNFSVSFWIKTPSFVRPYSHVISHVNAAGTAGWYFDMFSNRTGDYMRLRLTSTDGNSSSSADVPIEKDRFIHVIGTFDGSAIKVYKGANSSIYLVGSTKYTGTFWPYPLVPLTFGAPSYSYVQMDLSGTIDDVLIYNRTLGSSEIDNSFSHPAYNDKDLVGAWLFDQNLLDSSQYHNGGEMQTLVSSMTFSPDGKLFFVEKNTGNVMVLPKIESAAALFVHIPDSYVSWEEGLLGFTIDPLYEQNHFVYLYYTAHDTSSGNNFNRLVRFTDTNNKGTDEKILIDRIPASDGYHSGGALAFGPDDKLYVTVGDATEHLFAQDPSIMIGKVLRINRDGSIPSDNPYPNSPVYTIGHRNMYGIAFDEKSRIGIVTENGDYRFDEVNVIQKGGNYGFPTMQPPNVAPERANNSSIKPIRSYPLTIGPTQAVYYDLKKFPELTNKFLFGTYTGHIQALALNGTDHKLTEEDVIYFGFYPFEPLIAVAKSPQGEIYFAGYNIYKLEGLREKSEVLYPLKVVLSKDREIHAVIFDEASQQLSVNLTMGKSNYTSFMRMNVPSNLLENVSSVRLGYNDGSIDMITVGGNSSNLVQYTRTQDLGILNIKIIPKVAKVILSGQ